MVYNIITYCCTHREVITPAAAHRSHESPNILSFYINFHSFHRCYTREKVGVGDAYIKIEFHELIDHTRRLCTSMKRVVCELSVFATTLRYI